MPYWIHWKFEEFQISFLVHGHLTMGKHFGQEGTALQETEYSMLQYIYLEIIWLNMA
jgi:hypothetical protein